MSLREKLDLGRLTRAVLDTAVWREESEFPATQAWADEFERVLSFLECQSMFARFLPRLRAKEWEGALAEARSGFFFHRNGFHIRAWEPVEVPGRPGDLEIQWHATEAIFVEVKGPGWQGELSAEEREGRKRFPKSIHAEARSIKPTERVLYAAKKALPKLGPARPNLVVVVDDLFLSPIDLPEEYLSAALTSAFVHGELSRIGAILLLNAISRNDRVEYRHCFFGNRQAGKQLPTAVQDGLKLGSEHS